MSSTAFLGQGVLPLSAFFSDSMIVQDYPEKYTQPARGKPRAHHESYQKALSQGYLYGMRTDNGNKNWTRIVMFKPSEALLEQWERRVGYPFEAITLNAYGADASLYRVSATYMKGVGNQTLGFVSESDVKSIKQAAWSHDLGDAI